MQKLLLLLALVPTFAAAQEPLAVVHQLFADMASHNAEHARTLFLPEAMLYSSRPGGIAEALPAGKWLAQLGTSKAKWEERISEPKTLTHGTIAVVWAPYVFHLNGKLTHCGIDVFSLIQAKGAWKIATVADTREEAGCSSLDRR